MLTDIFAVLSNNAAIAAYTHTIFGALGVGGAFLVLPGTSSGSVARTTSTP